jgi:hypothetical protein
MNELYSFALKQLINKILFFMQWYANTTNINTAHKLTNI